MWQRLTFYDVRVICHYLGVLILVFTACLAVPFVTAVIFREWEPASRYLLACGITMVVGSALRFCRIQPGRLRRHQAIVVTGLAWIVLALLAAIPLALSGHYANFADALFEGVSGLTTTGASTAIDLDHMSYADNMWRFVMHFVGGLGLVVIGMTLGIFGKGSSGSLYASEARGEHVIPNVMHSARVISSIAASFIAIGTVVVMAVCITLGVSPVRAFLQSLWVSTSAFMTAGFTPMSQSILYYHSRIVEIALLLIIMLGTTCFALHTEILRGNVKAFFRDSEVRMTFWWLVVITVVFTAALASQQSFSNLPGLLRRGMFMIISAFSTTGFMDITPAQLTDSLSSGAFLVLAVLSGVGACVGSTAGGIKMQRLLLVLKSIGTTLKSTLAPDTARVGDSYYHLGRRTVSPALVREAMTVTALYAATYIIGSLVGIAHGYEATQSIFESISMASNGGLTSGIVGAGMPVSLELFYIFEMWAGRLEFVTLLAVIVQLVVSATPSSWSNAWVRFRAKQARKAQR